MALEASEEIITLINTLINERMLSKNLFFLHSYDSEDILCNKHQLREETTIHRQICHRMFENVEIKYESISCF